jgi:hypothetical protein
MAIFHLTLKIVTRGIGASAVGKAAYQSGDKLINEYDGHTFDYARKSRVVHKEILLPEHAPREFTDRSTLWNAVEKIEKAKNSQLARNVEMSLPVELTREQNISFLRRYVQEQFVDKGMCADVCVHDSGDGNPHAHILLTMRPFNEDGTWSGKFKKVYEFDEQGNKIYDPKTRRYKSRAVSVTDWNDRDKAEVWRAAWADAVNAELEKQGHTERVDHRSFARQGKEEKPTVHMGVAAMQMERRGIHTRRGDINRDVENFNKQLRQINARIKKLQSWLETAKEAAHIPTLIDIFQEIVDSHGESQYGKIIALQAAAKALIFFQYHNIENLAGMKAAVDKMRDEQSAVSGKLKPVERRIKTLDEHIRQSEIFKEHHKLNWQYEKLQAEYETAKKATGFFAKSKADKAREAAQDFYESNRAGLTLFAAADKYLKGVLQSHYDPKKLPPIAKWERERDDLRVEKSVLYKDYEFLKEDVQQAEVIKRNAEKVMAVVLSGEIPAEKEIHKSKSRVQR